MADRSPAPDTPELRERWGEFEFTEAWAAKADAAIARYPQGRHRSGMMIFSGAHASRPGLVGAAV